MEFARDGVAYKKGEKVSVNMLLASKFYQDGRVAVIPPELLADAKDLGCEDLFTKKKNGKDF